MTSIDDFDFDHSVEQAWRRFAVRLEDVLSMMDETEPLTLQPCSESEHWCLRFTQHVKGQITATIPSWGVSEEQAQTLRDLGWEPDDQGLHLTKNQDDCGTLAWAGIVALREVFNITHPVFLDSNVLAEILQEPAIVESTATTGSEEVVYGSLGEVQLAAAVAEELSEYFGAVPMRDQDGDFAVRVGSTMIFVRIPSDCQEIRLFSVVVHDISGRSRAAEVINDINAHSRWVRFSLVGDRIFVTMSIHASPFVASHLRQAITEMTQVADGVDDLLAESLEGKTTFPDEE